MESLFRASNLLVLPIWALMILLPRWRWTARVIQSPLVSVVPALVYIALVLPRLGTIWPVVSRPTLPGVEALLASPAGATIAWAHFSRLTCSSAVGFISTAKNVRLVLGS